MPRVARHLTHLPGALVHVIVRFVDGRFILHDQARTHYLRLLDPALRSSDWRLVSYALMSSHIHLGCVMGSSELRSWALPLHIRFARWINRSLAEQNPKALGHVIADRPTTKVMCPSRARFLIAYHHRNPIEAGVTTDPAISTWTSHRAYLGLAPSEGALDVALGLELAGFETTAEGRQALHAFVSRTEVTLADLASAEPVPAHPPARASASANDVIRTVGSVSGVPVEELLRGSRCRAVVNARRVALVAGLELGFTARAMADALGITSSGASRLLSRPYDAAQVRSRADRVAAMIAGQPG